MSERILVAVAWPYANSDIHLGHVTGVYLPADIFARYHRLIGNEVLMVSGSDSHGTPITITAEREGISPAEVVERYHTRFLKSWMDLGITFDLFTHTDTENHWAVTQDMFLRLLEKGYIYRDKTRQLYCESCGKFLPDRYVEGTCPYCGFQDARGDQCDKCGKPLDATELIHPRCKICGHAPVVRESEHFFLDLQQFSERLHSWIEVQTHWRPNVLNFSLNLLREGLHGRAITRDIEWGIPVPVKGFEHKRIYVWFDAVIGYLAASKEWAVIIGQPEAWRDWWQGPSRAYYFLAKDNIPFHTIIWPSMLMGYGGLNLPYDVPANEFLNLEGQKFSSSRNWAVWLPDYLSRYDPDPLRYTLTINMPEQADTNFTWGEFLRRNNDELVATYGNLAHRVLTFSFRNFDERVPEPGELTAQDQAILARAENAFGPVGELIASCKFKAAITEVMAVAHEANRYLDEAAPWLVIKQDRARAATACYVTLRVVDNLKMLFYPFLPFSSQRLHEMLGYENDLLGRQFTETHQETTRTHQVLRYDPRPIHAKWAPSELPVGQRLREPVPLFKKLDEEIVEQEVARLGRTAL